MNSTDNGSVEYRADFAKRAKKLYPDSPMFHKMVDVRSMQVEGFLEAGRHVHIEELHCVVCTGDLHAIRAEVTRWIEREQLYQEFLLGKV